MRTCDGVGVRVFPLFSSLPSFLPSHSITLHTLSSSPGNRAPLSKSHLTKASYLAAAEASEGVRDKRREEKQEGLRARNEMLS